MQVTTEMWIAFGVLLAVLLAIDLTTHRGGRHTSSRAAIIWTVIWIGAGLAFGVAVWAVMGTERAEEYIAAYLIEKSLSLDNLFVFLIIFQSLKIRPEHQRTALTWGIFGALIFRAIFVFAGAAAIRRWEWVEIVFGLILLYAAYKTVSHDESEDRENRVVLWLANHLPVTTRRDAGKFFVHVEGKRMVTPLLIAVVGLELTDIMFAVDSVPAALAISRDEFIVYSSNAFAILGLRSLYIVLAGTISELHYLKYGLAVLLTFAALKLITNRWYHISPGLSIAIIVAVIGITIAVSVWRRRVERRSPSRTGEDGA